MLTISIEMTVYTEMLNITNELALPFCAWAVESFGNGANGTDDEPVAIGAVAAIVVVVVALVSGNAGVGGFVTTAVLLVIVASIGIFDGGTGTGADGSGNGANGICGASGIFAGGATEPACVGSTGAAI